ncbi:MAG: type II toxin-antitoxin system RelE/ParE family toxin [Bacteroidetes bacterium]|nr:MAG: type II toxin-antitoxin system RelE/ParE family toxin [Bacteroidota bacterium]
MELAVYWTRFAEDKLDVIYDYYEFKAGTRIARKLISDIIDKTIGLEKNPYIGQKEELLSDRPQNFRYLVFKNYKIIYWINQNKNRIDIINVFDTRQNPMKMKKME